MAVNTFIVCFASIKNLRTALLIIMVTALCGGCAGRRTVTLDLADGAWYGRSYLLNDTSRNIRLFSSRELFEKYDPSACPKKYSYISGGTIISVGTEYDCEGAEPPKGKQVLRVGARYTISKRGNRLYIYLFTDKLEAVYRISGIENLRSAGTIIDLNRER